MTGVNLWGAKIETFEIPCSHKSFPSENLLKTDHTLNDHLAWIQYNPQTNLSHSYHDLKRTIYVTIPECVVLYMIEDVIITKFGKVLNTVLREIYQKIAY